MKRMLLAALGNSLLMALFVLSLTFPALSQQSRSRNSSFFEAGITAGPSNFLGDLGGTYGRGQTFLKDNNFPLTKLMTGAYIAFHPNNWLGIRLAVNKGKLEGDDGIIQGKGGLEEVRKIRSANFRTNLQEAFLAAEIYPTKLFESSNSLLFFRLQPYGLLGVGVFHFNPQGKDPVTGQWVDLKPLHTEGQGFEEYPNRKEYALTQINVPMGFGVKYLINEKVDLSFEVVHRKTFTDYIDDVSTTYIDPAVLYKHLGPELAQRAERMSNRTDGSGLNRSLFGPGSKRGNSSMNDAYYSFGLKLGIRLGRASDDLRWSRSVRCPRRI